MFYDLAVQAWLRCETKIGAREGPEADGAAAYLLGAHGNDVHNAQNESWEANDAA
jgi:hypothetical protein